MIASTRTTLFGLVTAAFLFFAQAGSSSTEDAEGFSPLSDQNTRLMKQPDNTTEYYKDGLMINGLRCGTVPPTPEAAHALDAALAARGGIGRSEATCRIVIPVAFHVLRHNDGGMGNLTNQQINDQIQVMNDGFATTNFQFVLHSIERVNNTTWSLMNSESAEIAAKQALAIDPAKTLNVYTCTGCEDNLGWAYFPDSFKEDHFMHGIVALYSSFPGGDAAPYNEGDTMTHEAGHYLGLYHTFQNGCAAPGDRVNDTPFEASPAAGCPTGRNSCPQSGLDPIHNFMDYTIDSCMDEFTSGQSDRADSIVALHKPSLVSCEEPPVLDIKANSADGPVSISTGDALSVTVALDTGSMAGTGADWWVLAYTPFDWFYYDLSSDWQPGMTATFQGNLIDLPTYEVLNTAGLPAGSYTFYFGVDSAVNGSIDLDKLYYDSVDVEIFEK